MARTTFNSNQVLALLGGVRQHGNLDRACRECGMPPRTAYEWLQAGKSDPERFPLHAAFGRAVEANRAAYKQEELERALSVLAGATPEVHAGISGSSLPAPV